MPVNIVTIRLSEIEYAFCKEKATIPGTDASNVSAYIRSIIHARMKKELTRPHIETQTPVRPSDNERAKAKLREVGGSLPTASTSAIPEPWDN